MADRGQDWLRQAIRDLELAEEAQRAERHEWACFAAQQAAEKALKGLHPHLKQEAWGHVVARLIGPRQLPYPYPESEQPSGGRAVRALRPLQSKEALSHAREILEFVRSQMA